MARGVSTVLDVAVCLLLIGAAVATLTASVPDASENPTPNADRTVALLTTNTDTVRLDRHERRIHGTPAGHLAAAAVTSATLDGDPLVGSTHADAVDSTVSPVLGDRADATATWEPYPGAVLSGRVETGEPPPPRSTVGATTVTVDVGIDSIAGDDYETVAASLADAIVSWLFPPERTRTALNDERTAGDVAERYRTMAATLDASIEPELAAGNTQAVNDQLVNALASRFESELKAQFDTPESAAANVSTDVKVAVRRWEP